MFGHHHFWYFLLKSRFLIFSTLLYKKTEALLLNLNKHHQYMIMIIMCYNRNGTINPNCNRAIPKLNYENMIYMVLQVEGTDILV